MLLLTAPPFETAGLSPGRPAYRQRAASKSLLQRARIGEAQRLGQVRGFQRDRI